MPPRPTRAAPRRRRASSNWGGARPGAGRPPRGPISSEPHKARPRVSPRHPVLIVARVVPEVGRLDRRRTYRAIRRAIETALARTDFRVVELAVHPGRLELVVEADGRRALARGMQGLLIAAARHLNRATGRKGTVFPDRYRARALTTRRAVRAALAELPAPARTCSPATWLLRVEGARRRPPPPAYAL
jgi:hypothetical protein